MDEKKEELIKMLVRLSDEYKWNWGLVRRQINRQFNLNYDAVTLRRLYNQEKAYMSENIK